ncbi:hypothetical protein [Halobellus captivus]|uniref:hypothetical protein n=1 Tax=Halobellus captivus TaxID=2592614 RepID=UPI0011A5F9AD|nr:hypothetical protein [Halobellus captivus]
MSRSVRSQGDVDIGPTLVECDPTEMNASDRVRDLDQLSERDCRAFLDAVEDATREIDASELTAGDVVRYTAYYRVV